MKSPLHSDQTLEKTNGEFLKTAQLNLSTDDIFIVYCLQGSVDSTPSLQCEQFQNNLQFILSPSEEGTGKPQVRGRGFCLKTGEGLDKRQSKKGGCKHCSDLINVKLTPESILLPTSREEQPRHGRTGDLTDQYGLPKADEIKLMIGIQSAPQGEKWLETF